MSERRDEGDCDANGYDGEGAEHEDWSGAGLEDGDFGGTEEVDHYGLCEEARRGLGSFIRFGGGEGCLPLKEPVGLEFCCLSGVICAAGAVVEPVAGRHWRLKESVEEIVAYHPRQYVHISIVELSGPRHKMKRKSSSCKLAPIKPSFAANCETSEPFASHRLGTAK